MREIEVESGNVPIKTLISWFCFLIVMPHRQTHRGKAPSELLFNWKVNTRLSLLKLNRSIVNDEEKFPKYTLATRFGYVTIGEVKNGLKVNIRETR